MLAPYMADRGVAVGLAADHVLNEVAVVHVGGFAGLPVYQAGR